MFWLSYCQIYICWFQPDHKLVLHSSDYKPATTVFLRILSEHFDQSCNKWCCSLLNGGWEMTASSSQKYGHAIVDSYFFNHYVLDSSHCTIVLQWHLFHVNGLHISLKYHIIARNLVVSGFQVSVHTWDSTCKTFSSLQCINIYISIIEI